MFIFLCTGSLVSGQYYGMQFSAHDFRLDQRSGLDLTPDHAFDIKGDLNLQFHLRLDPGHASYFGYIFRLILGDQNIDLIHGIVPGNPNNFELILGDKTSKVAFAIPVEELQKEWLKLRFTLDFKSQRITCHFNDETFEDDLIGFNTENGYRLMFGANSFGNFSSTDVPAMILRDVEVSNGDRTTARWSLNEINGTIAHSVPAGNNGTAYNPTWLLKRHNTWELALNKEVAGKIKTTYDSRNDNLYMVSKDTIFIYNINTDSLVRITANSELRIQNSNEILYDTINRRLISYSLENNYLSVFDFDKRQWSPHDKGELEEIDYWHHNRLITPDGLLVAIGGYGHYMYKNSAWFWNVEKNSFDSLRYKGDFHPRYLAGLGFNPQDSLYYVIGGYGSESGKQSENPDYYYEILSFSTTEMAMSRFHEFENTRAGFCFASSVVFDDSNNMYALYFNKYQFENRLQLVQIPLDNPKIIELANPIKYNFLDVNSFSDLHFNKPSNSLVAVSTYLSEGITMVSVHSIAFPPQAHIINSPAPEKSSSNLMFYFVAALVLIVTLLLIIFRRKGSKKLQEKSAPLKRETIHRVYENSIILFGGFQVIDRKGNDITGQFTPLPKKLFLFILLHSLRNNKGVSSNTLYETFWFDKSVESARNNRAVNIVKLKSLLENLDSVSISKETGYWKFDFDPSRIHIDFYDYLQIANHTSELSREDIIDLLAIIENRPLLNNTNADWLDPFKSEVSNDIIDALLRYIERSNDDPEFLLHLTNCIFINDSASEEALKVQCRLLIKQGKHSLAKKAYSKFISEYRQLYDEEYKLSFNQIIEEN